MLLQQRIPGLLMMLRLCCCCCCCYPGTERFRYAYVWRTLMKAGVHVAGGSDAPVEAPTPLIGMADVTWRHQNGSPMAGGEC